MGLLAPAAASAVLYQSTKKATAPTLPRYEVCDTVAGPGAQCSLRAAIEESNASTSVDDSIKFDGGFMGDPTDDKIAIGGAGAAKSPTK